MLLRRAQNTGLVGGHAEEEAREREGHIAPALRRLAQIIVDAVLGDSQPTGRRITSHVIEDHGAELVELGRVWRGRALALREHHDRKSDKRQSQKAERPDEDGERRPASKKERDDPRDRVDVQNVPPPEERDVQRAKKEKRAHPAKDKRTKRCAPRLCPRELQCEPRAEQHGEQAHELAVKEQQAQIVHDGVEHARPRVSGKLVPLHCRTECELYIHE